MSKQKKLVNLHHKAKKQEPLSFNSPYISPTQSPLQLKQQLLQSNQYNDTHIIKVNGMFVNNNNFIDISQEKLVNSINQNDKNSRKKMLGKKLFNITKSDNRKHSKIPCNHQGIEVKASNQATITINADNINEQIPQQNQNYLINIELGNKLQSNSYEFQQKQKQLNSSNSSENKDQGIELFQFLNKHKQKDKQNCAIKAYNYVCNNDNNPHNCQSKPLDMIDSPENVTYIIEAMKQCRNIQDNFSNKNQNHKNNKFKIKNNTYIATQRHYSKNKSQRQNYSNNQKFRVGNRTTRKTNIQTNIKSQNISDSLPSDKKDQKYWENLLYPKKCNSQERDLLRLHDWLNEQLFKPKNKDNSQYQVQDGTTITNKIHSLHLAFSQACRNVSKYSNKLSQTFIMIHSQYHQIYQQLVSSLISQNKTTKKNNQNAQQRLNSTIAHYEKQLLNIRDNFDKKSSKVIENFHKCINIKNQLQRNTKVYQISLKEQKNKLKYMQECLTRAINILVQIGNQRFNFLSKKQQQAIMQLSGSFKLCPEDSKLFYQWCSTIIRTITTMKSQKPTHSKQIKSTVKDFALSAIGKFMVDFDSNLSIQDVKGILQNYVPHYIPNVMQIEIQDILLEKSGEKISQKRSRVPDLYEIRERLNGKNMEIQVNQNWQYQSKAIQSSPVYESVAVSVKPREKQKQTSTAIWIRQKIKLSSCEVNLYLWAQRKQQIGKQKLINKNKIKPDTQILTLKVSNQKQKIRKPCKKVNESTQTQLVQINKIIKPSKGIDLQKKQLSNQKHKRQKSIDFLIQEQEVLKKKQDQKQNLELLEYNRSNSKRKPRNSRKVTFDSVMLNPNKKVQQKLLVPKKQSQFNKIKKSASSRSIKKIIQSSSQEEYQQLKRYKKQTVVEKLQDVKYQQNKLQKNTEQFINAIINLRSMKNLKIIPISLNNTKEFIVQESDISRTQPAEKICSHIQKAQLIPLRQQKMLLNLIKVPRKFFKSKYQQYTGNVHQFKVELIEKIQQRNKLITQSAMWSHKKSCEIKKICQKMQSMRYDRSLPQYNFNTFIPNNNNQLLSVPNNLSKVQSIKILIKSQLNPILNFYMKLCRQLISYKDSLSTQEFRKQLHTGKKVPYYHRLSPLLYYFVNTVLVKYNMNSLNNTASSKYYQKYFIKIYQDIKTLKISEKQPIFEIYQQLLDGRQTQLDVFIKTLQYFGNQKCQSQILINLEEVLIYINVAQVQLFLVLEDYLNQTEINSLITQLRSNKKQKQNHRKSQTESVGSISFDDRIPLCRLILKIFNALKAKKKLLLKRYQAVLQFIGVNHEHQYVAYNDFLYLLQVLPLQKSIRQKLTYQCSFYLVYWDKKQPCVPYDRILFLLDSVKFLNNITLQQKQLFCSNSSLQSCPSSIILEYFILKIQSDPSLQKIYQNLQQNPQFIIQNIYKLFYRVPSLIYKLTQDLKNPARSKHQSHKNSIMLVMFYRLIIVHEIQKIYCSGVLGMIQALGCYLQL